MGYQANYEDEHPLWRNYMDKLGEMNPKEQTEWMEQIDPGVELPFPTKSYSAYSEEDFLEMLDKDEVFRDKWGTL
jgi:hypothetical protein